MQEEAPQPSTPRVSVLILSRNNIEALRKCVSAVDAAPNRDSIEILILDQASTDGSGQFDVEHPNVTVLRMAKYFGWVKAMNIGIRTATGEFILFLDPTVVLEPDAVAKLAEHLAHDGDSTAVCPLLLTPTGQPAAHIRPLPRPGNEFPVLEPPSSIDQPLRVEFPDRAALMVRKLFIQGMNYLDVRYGDNWGDADLCWNIRRANKKITLVPSARAVWNPAPPPEDNQFQADRLLGAAAYLGKHFGFFKGFLYQTGAVFKSLASFNFGLLGLLLSGQKLDGNQ